MSTQGKVRRRLVGPDSLTVKWIVVLATVIGGLAAAVPLEQAAVRWWRDRTRAIATNTPSTMDGRATIEQGSAEADALIRQLFDTAAAGRRLDLDAILVATPSQAGGKATNGYTVFYNCGDGAGEPGADRCSTAKLYWQSNPLPFEVRNGAGWHLTGTYSVLLDPNKGQVYGATIVAFGLTSVTG